MFPISEKYKLLVSIVYLLVQKHHAGRIVLTEQMINSTDWGELVIRRTSNNRIVVAIAPKPKPGRRN